ncbi:unnamed protein product, partial [Larinioides sclopetarius]
RKQPFAKIVICGFQDYLIHCYCMKKTMEGEIYILKKQTDARTLLKRSTNGLQSFF